MPTYSAIPSSSGAAALKINHESVRLAAYIGFWVMAAEAIGVTNFFVKSKPDWDATKTPLYTQFGYNNICINWDYSPAKELTAMVYPIFELPLLAYLVLGHAHVYVNQHKVTPAFWRFCKLTLPLEIVLMVWFRMIFVIDAFDNVNGHTSFFQLFQILLALVAVKNMMYYNMIHKEPLAEVLEFFGAPSLIPQRFHGPIQIAYVTLVCLTTAWKIIIVRTQFAGHPILITTEGGPERDMIIAAFTDRLWMLLNAIFPMLFAYCQSRKISSLSVDLSLVGGS